MQSHRHGWRLGRLVGSALIVFADCPVFGVTGFVDHGASRWRQERVRRGYPSGGNVPYGFRRSGENFIVEPGEARAVRLISERARLGDTVTGRIPAIAKVYRHTR